MCSVICCLGRSCMTDLLIWACLETCCSLCSSLLITSGFKIRAGPLGSTGPAAAGTLLTHRGHDIKQLSNTHISSKIQRHLNIPNWTAWSCWGSLPLDDFRLWFSHLVQSSVVLLIWGFTWRKALNRTWDNPLSTTYVTLKKVFIYTLDVKDGICNTFVKKEMSVKYLPLWAATSTRIQDMLPALFPGLVYTIDLLQITGFRWDIQCTDPFQCVCQLTTQWPPIYKRRETKIFLRNKLSTHLFLFISLHLVRFQQEHLKATQIREWLKLYRGT